MSRYRFDAFDGVKVVIGLIIAALVVGHCAYVHATCDGKVIKGYFDQPVCLERDR